MVSAALSLTGALAVDEPAFFGAGEFSRADCLVPVTALLELALATWEFAAPVPGTAAGVTGFGAAVAADFVAGVATGFGTAATTGAADSSL